MAERTTLLRELAERCEAYGIDRLLSARDDQTWLDFQAIDHAIDCFKRADFLKSRVSIQDDGRDG